MANLLLEWPTFQCATLCGAKGSLCKLLYNESDLVTAISPSFKFTVLNSHIQAVWQPNTHYNQDHGSQLYMLYLEYKANL